MNWCRRRGKTIWVGVARPRIRVEGCIAKVFIRSPVKLARARLRRKPNLRARSAAILRSIICSQNLDFLRRVHICGPQAGPVRTRACCRSPVKRNQILGVARAVEIRRPLREAKVEVCQRRASRSRHQRRQPDRVSAIQLQRINLFPRHQLLHRRRFRLQLHRRPRYLHSLRSRPYHQRSINHQIRRWIKFIIGALELLEALRLRRHRVQPRRHVGYDVVARLVRGRLPLDPAVITSHRDLRVRDRGPRRILYKPRNLSQV